MKLLSLDLDHWCQHTELHIDFPDSPLIRIDGPNNIGKSNLIRAIGRALAQGRSEFGDASSIQYGAKQASINLKAKTADQTTFSIQRIIGEKTSKSTLLVPGRDPLTKSEEIETLFAEWFGPTDVLLSLFIASQGEISRLLRTSGKQRLVEFIEICGFKTFLQKQAAINKLIKSFPALNNPEELQRDNARRTDNLKTQIVQRKQAQTLLPPIASSRLTLAELTARKETLKQATEELARKRQSLQTLQNQVEKKLPDLQQLAREISELERQITTLTAHINHETYINLSNQATTLQTSLDALPQDATDYKQAIANLNVELQTNHKELATIQATEEELTAKKTLRKTEEARITLAETTVAQAPASSAWYSVPIQELQALNQSIADQSRLTGEKDRIVKRIQQLSLIPAPSAAKLALLQNVSSRLDEIIALKKHTEESKQGQCVVCQQPWLAGAIASRLSQLQTEQKTVEEAIAASPGVQQELDTWQNAQKETIALTELEQKFSAELTKHTAYINAFTQKFQLPEKELKFLSEVILAYKSVIQAQTISRSSLLVLDQEIQNLAVNLQARAQDKARLTEANASSTTRLTTLLGAQTTQQQMQTRKHQLDSELQAVKTAIIALAPSSSAPTGFIPGTNYAGIKLETETKLGHKRLELTNASTAWAQAAEKANQEAALRSQIADLEKKTANPWTEQDECLLSTTQTQLTNQQSLEAEIAMLKQQEAALVQESNQLLNQKTQYEKQASNICDLQAISNFLSYDNGPQKFLEIFFMDVINQTNSLVSEMGLPVHIEMGPNLEVLIVDQYKRTSSSKSLGGGYANLIGIAFRIALQKLVIPKVNTIILDEPSTHVDEGNMELLIPFFEKLKGQLHVYGIEQCIIIDHHPAWKNSDVELIQLGKRTIS